MLHQIQINHLVTDEFIDDIMVTALEGGINYWCNKVEVLNNDYKGCKYASEVISKGGTLLLTDSEDGTIHLLDLVKFLRGLTKYLSEYEFIREGGDIDADKADCIIQLALFGELVYS